MTKCNLSDAKLSAFAQVAGIKRNVLSPLKSEKSDMGSVPELDDAQKKAVEVALQPKCVSKLHTLFYNDALEILLCAGRGEMCVLVGRENEDNFLSTIKKEDIAATVLAGLAETDTEQRDESAAKMSTDSFLLLLALTDAYRRRYMEGLLSHKLPDASIDPQMLYTIMEEAYTSPDTRWLLPFVLMAMEFPEITDIRAAMDGLCTCGIMDGASFSLTGDGERFANELMYRLTATHLVSLRVRGATLMQEEVLLLRTRDSLWCASLGDDVTQFTLSSAEAYKLIRDMLEEMDEPPENAEKRPLTTRESSAASIPGNNAWLCVCGSMNNGIFCPNCGRCSVPMRKDGIDMPPAASPSAPIRQTRPAYCQNCGARLSDGVFCENCGAKIE